MPKKFNRKTFVLPEDRCPLCKEVIHPSQRCQLTAETARCPHCKGIYDADGDPRRSTS